MTRFFPAPEIAPATKRPVSLRSGVWVWLAVLALVLAGWLAYRNSLSGAFVYDDEGTVISNTSIRELCPLSGMPTPPGGGVTTSGRPFANLSFALNHAMGGLDVRGYHVANISIHILAALAPFGVLRAQAGRFDEAVRQYEAVLRLDPRQADTHNNLANVYLQTGRTLDARREYLEALRLRPSFTDARRNLAITEEILASEH